MITHSIDKDWWFLAGDGLDSSFIHLQPAGTVPFEQPGWRALDVPHDWSIESPRSPDAPCGLDGGYFREGIAWYRKHFSLPPDQRVDQRVFIEFEGVYKDAEIIVNGHAAGRHAYGYTSFVMDITDFLNPESEQMLLVRVDNAHARHSRWYSGSGIYRHVWLHVAEQVYIPRWGLSVTTPVVDEQEAVVAVSTEVRNASELDRCVDIRWTVESPDGRLTVGCEQALTLGPGKQAVARGTMRIARPALWSPDSPTCYSLQATVTECGRELDRYTIPFGIRSMHFSAAEGFVLNGTPCLLKGGCVHHDHGPLGAVSLDRAEERKVELLKANGFNAVRCAHNPPAPAFLDACDRLGLLVIDEAFDAWRAGKRSYDYHRDFDACWQADLESMVRRDRNHPSIVLWSIGNELFERHQPEGGRLARMLTERVHELDPSRPVTAGICHTWRGVPWEAHDGVLAPLDVCGYNYLADFYESDHARFPERVIISTESYPREQFSYWRDVERLSYVAGDFVWAAIDYLGEAGVGNCRVDDAPEQQFKQWPWHQANCGDLDICGFKRPQSYYRDVVWGRASAPVIFVHRPLPDGRSWVPNLWGWDAVLDSWNWDGWEGHPLRVDVYTDSEQVELFLNGCSLGVAAATAKDRYMATFRVPYAPGELKAVASSSGRASAAGALRTVGPPTAIRLTADRERLCRDANDLAYVTVELCDAAGRRVPDADHELVYEIDGPGSCVAIGNGNPCSEDPYRGHRHHAWQGRALAILQSTGDPGALHFRARSAGMDAGSVIIQVE